jgi:hypothetical protein
MGTVSTTHLPPLAVRRALILAAIAAVALLGAYCAGQHHQQAVDEEQHYESARKAIVTDEATIKTKIVHDTVSVAATATAAQTADAKALRADSVFHAHVQVLSDSTVSIDHGPPTTEIPVALALPPIQLCPSAIAADTAAYHALRVLLDDQIAMTTDETHRADLAEAHAKAIKGPRFGFRSGVAIGAALAIGVIRLLR